ncbi:TP53-binding protein 1 [Scomber japonicus]|uniref:TP53-binding protein 1 n=1 Tax=Scomber japonicus TaxID=13676 RepID=UPI002305D910|nr:TP53-binding protein 1 [Scomber japonicus]
MDPGGSELDSSLPQPENPCLIVEDSQPDSVALEDDPESSYRALLARRLSSLQPTARSPVLELISSPLGSRCSQTDSQSESSQSNNQAEPGVLAAANPSSAIQEESQVISTGPPTNKSKSSSEDSEMDSGADSTTHCVQAEEGAASQFGFLELSQSQDLRGEVNSQEEDEPDSETPPKSAEQNVSAVTSGSCDSKAVRSEVSSSSSSEGPGESGRKLSVQALLHSQNVQASDEPEQQDCEILSSQEDMFDNDKTGAAVDSTVSEPEQQSRPTPTPASTLRLLHLSGQGTLVQQSLSQSSVDFVAPTQDDFTSTPLIIPSSPTGPENEHGADEPMDTSLPPEDRAAGEEKDEPMDTDAAATASVASKPQPSASTPVSQNSPGFVLERTLSLPSQPEFSHDAFVPTQSQESPQQSDQKKKTASSLSQSAQLESAPFTLPLQLSDNTESVSQAPKTSEEVEEDSQATQIEELELEEEEEEKKEVDTSDSAIPKKSESNGVSAESCKNKTAASSNVQTVNVKEGKSSADVVSCSQPKLDSSSSSSSSSSDVIPNSCVEETPAGATPTPTPKPTETPTPSSLDSQSVISQTSAADVKGGGGGGGGGGVMKSSSESSQQKCGAVGNSQEEEEEEEEEVMEEEEEGESTLGGGASAIGLVLSQSQLLSPEPMEEEEEQEEEEESVVVVTESERDSQPKTANSSQPIRASPSTNGHQAEVEVKEVHAAPDRLSQAEGAGPEAEGLKDKSLSDSSGEISFHFTLPKEGELIGPAVGATPPLINQLKQTLRHSTPIEITSFSEKPDGVGDVSTDVAMAASDIIVSGESGEDTADKSDGKLSLRMKLVTPVEEGSSERFSLQKPTLSEEDRSVVKVTTVAKAVTSPSVFSRVRQVHRQQEPDDDSQDNSAPVRSELFASPQKSPHTSSLGFNSLPNSQSEPSQQQQQQATPQQENAKDPSSSVTEPSEERRGPPEAPAAPNRTDGRQRAATQQTNDNTVTSSPSNKLRQRTVSQQTSFDAPGFRSPAGRGEPESPSFRRAAGPAHRRHVRTIQEVRTTVTRIITDVYYEDGKEVDRKVTEENEEPVVDCQVLDGDISPCRTGSSSMTSGDLGDISSLSSKASSHHHSSGGTSSSGLTRPDFIMPLSRGAKSISPRRGGGHQQRGHRGHRAGSVVTMDSAYGTFGSRAFVPLSPRGRARRGRPPSRSSPSRGGPGSLHRLSVHGHPHSSSDDEHFARMLPPRLPVSPTDAELHGHSDSLRSSPEEASSAGSSFVGLRVVAKWSSNGYFYSGRIIKDAGEGRFRLRFDDGYECEVMGKDILLCDPIPLETEVTALLEDEYFSIGVIKGHKTEGQDLFYSVEKDGQRQWHNRTAVILSLEQGNKLREQHSLGPYEPLTPLAKASDISLDNLVEGKRRRRGPPAEQNTPNRGSSGSNSPRTPGPSGKRKLIASEEERTPSKRGRRGAGARAGQRVGVCNTSGSGTDLPAQSCDLPETHGPLPQNTTLFMGFAFMLTASSEIDRLTNRLSGSDDEDDYVQTGPYNKAYTESQLQAGGGFVLPDFNEEQCKAAYQSLLIADQHCRTRKYLLCLASGVPCVSHIWVRDCCRDNKLLNYRNYLLPAGVGPNDAIIEWHPRCSPFKALRILLVFEKPVDLWTQLIAMGGGSAVRQFHTDKDGSDIPAGKYDVVVTDHACPPLVEKNVTSQEVPLVSAEWLIQSLICGERLGFHSKPQYRHDYSSSIINTTTTTTTTSSSSSTSS